MQTVIIHVSNDKRLAVVSYGNGTAYELRDTLNGKSVLFQGDEANRFIAELDGLLARLSVNSTLYFLFGVYDEVMSDFSEADGK